MTNFQFQPSTQAPFQFQPSLDGDVYNAVVSWNLFGARYYLNVYALSGALVFSMALIGSPTGTAIEQMTWEAGKVTVVTADPHGYDIGKTVDLTLSGCAPAAYNGRVEAFVTEVDQIVFSLDTDPGLATIYGTLSYDISMTAGYFASTLVFRESSSQFEVNP